MGQKLFPFTKRIIIIIFLIRPKELLGRGIENCLTWKGQYSWHLAFKKSLIFLKMVWIILIFMILKTYGFRLFQCSYQSYSCQVKRRQVLRCSYICKCLHFVLFYGIYIINLFFFKKKKKAFQFQTWLNFFSLLHQSFIIIIIIIIIIMNLSIHAQT